MTNVILQPASGPEPRRHYIDTVVNPVPVDVMQAYLADEEYKSLNAPVYTNGICAWGIVPTGESKWGRIQPGDTVLFARDSFYYSLTTVIGKVHNTELATKLWGIDDRGRTWEWMYFIMPPNDIHVSYEELNSVLVRPDGRPFESNYVPQGVNVLTPRNSDSVLSVLDQSAPGAEILSASGIIDSLESLDSISTTVVRKEQSALRRRLLGGATTGLCGICGRDYPIELLVAGHIKKRAECTDSEKADISAIAMPMCLMGCDALYETGYVTVGNGQVQVAQVSHPGLEGILLGLAGNSCPYWRSENEKYFRWHRRTTFRG